MAGKCSRKLILSRSEHDQCAAYLHFDVVAFEQLVQFGIFSSGIENNSFGLRFDDIIVVISLVSWIEVECYCVDVFQRNHFCLNGYSGDFSGLLANGYYRMAFVNE